MVYVAKLSLNLEVCSIQDAGVPRQISTCMGLNFACRVIVHFAADAVPAGRANTLITSRPQYHNQANAVA
jgi:hypothetical protein